MQALAKQLLLQHMYVTQVVATEEAVPTLVQLTYHHVLFWKCQNYSSFAVERIYQQNLIAKCILLLVKEEADISLQNEQGATKLVAFEFVKQRTGLKSYFSPKC